MTRMTKSMKQLILTFFVFLIANELIAQSIKADTVYELSSINALTGQKPKFPGDSLSNYIMDNMIVPQDDCVGKVYIEFIVEKNGGLSNFKILHGPCASWDSAVTNCFRKMPAWIPANQSGKPIRVYVRMPVIVDVRK